LSSLRKLAGQTAIYGLSSIVGRLLNYLLVPLYTRVFDPAHYGVVAQLYAFASFLNIVFTYGLETGYFRYAEKHKDDPRVYSTALFSIIGSSLLLALPIIAFSSPIASWMNDRVQQSHMMPGYIACFAGILAFDAITRIPFARLRQENKALRFAVINIIGIAVNVLLNVFFLIICPKLADGRSHDLISRIYDPSIGVGYIFYINLIASFVTLLFLLPEIVKARYGFDSVLWKSILVYSLPLMVYGFAGMINETFDRILLPYLLPDKATAMEQLGIYSACYKISILMTLFVQTFRYAAEPFFFSQASNENAKETYARVMHYFIIVGAFIFLAIMMYIDIVKSYVGKEFRSGIGVVPILLMANLCVGIFYNLSIWFKLTGKTRWGAFLSIIGAAITLILNFLLIPIMGYMGAAWATLICYASMMLLSYFIGQKYYPVNYPVKSFFFFISVVLALYAFSEYLRNFIHAEKMILAINSLFILVFVVATILYERPKNSYFRTPKF
jgi:O-antigen/teichoic acid export membrane protein